MRTILFFILFFVPLILKSEAQVSPLKYITTEELPACMSMSDLVKITKYIAVRDTEAYASVMQNGSCTTLKTGNKVQIMETQEEDGVTYAKIRLIGYDDVTIWTYKKALKATQ